MSTAGVAVAPARQARNFVDLPIETQKEIVGLCSQSDLICLSLVSQHFRDLAAAQLYRNFHIVFPDEDDPAFDSPIDGLASGLDTFVTSDYNYAQHLRDLSLDTLSAGDKAENAYKPYLYTVSCGKFMNTLLLLTLRKAGSLESFRWNIRVELSRPVYRALHQIRSLSHLHIRLQSGPSLYEAPPPLPFSSSQSSTTSSSSTSHAQGSAPLVPPLPPPPAPVAFTATSAPPPIFYIPSAENSVPTPGLPPKPAPKSKAPKKASVTKEPPTLSGFKNLKTLSVLDIDSLDIVTELKSCVRNSSSTLTKLRLSFSDSLGMQARKPPPTIDPDDSDPEDEFQVVPVTAAGSGYHEDSSEPAQAFRAQEEKKNQESVLGRIFDVESSIVRKVQRKPREKEKETKDEATSDPDSDFISALKIVANKLMKDLHGSGDFAASQQEILDTIYNAAALYVSRAANTGTEREEKKDESKNASVSGPNDEKTDVKIDEKGSEESETSLFGTKPTKSKEVNKDITPEDINIEEPEGELMMESQEPSSDKFAAGAQSPSMDNVVPKPSSSKGTSAVIENGSPLTPNVEKAMTNLASQKLDPKTLAEYLQVFPEQNPLALSADEVEAQSQRLHEYELMREYLRSTRGMALRSLCIYLIPVKASVLSRAIDLRALHRLTLLNVGPQAPIWSLLHKENKESPLALRKIFTDNVSVPLLTFVSQLEELHEFFILERDNKYKPESFAPKTTVSIEQIRRMVLKKHLPTLIRLMVKNMVDTSWDFDEKTILLLCKRGMRLEELACTMGIRNIHTLMRRISGLASLRALHIVQLRNDDTCVWVMRETRRFLVDNVSHHSHMKLEWISIDEDDKVERIIRPTELPKKEKKSKKSKGKQKATNHGSDLFPIMPSPDTWDTSSESSDDDNLNEPQLETLENVHFSDVWGVRIFKKEILAGRV